METFLYNRHYYEQEASETALFGSGREICLCENIELYINSTDLSVLDVGCGDGYLLTRLKNRPHIEAVFASDISLNRIKKAKVNTHGVIFLQSDVSFLPFKNNCFDLVICSEVLEHVPDWQKALHELIRVAKKNVIVTVPNQQKLVKIRCVKCGTENYLSGHINSFSKKDFLDWLKNIRQVKIKEFHTIYTYNRLSLKLHRKLRLLLDSMAWKLSPLISFLKPNYLLIFIQK